MKKALIIPVILIASACAPVSQQKVETTPALQEQQVKADLLEENIPVYPGFHLIPEKSFIYESGNIKVGRLVFKGNAPVKNVVSYYKATLPDKGWEPLTITVYGKNAELTFTNPDQVLQIQVNRGFSETYLTIQVGPRGELTNQQ